MIYKIDLYPKQKSPNGCFVKITDKMPSDMRHFTHDTFAIVKSTYAGNFGGSNWNKYTLIVKEESGIWRQSSCYREDQLELIEDECMCKELERDFKQSKKRNKGI